MRTRFWITPPVLCGLMIALACGQTSRPAAVVATFDIRAFGAGGDGKTLCTSAIQNAIDHCAKAGGGRVVVPAGTFLTGTLRLRSHVDLNLSAGAKLLGSPRLADYGHVFAEGGKTSPEARILKTDGNALLCAEGATAISITGTGTIDGNGTSPELARPDGDPLRPRLILMVNCRDVVVTGVTLRDSAQWVQYYLGCEQLRISGIHVFSHANFNNDGLDVDGKDIVISDCTIDSDDDGLCLKSDRAEPCENATIRNCVVGSNCNGIKTGTNSHGGFRNVTVSNCVVHAASDHHLRPWKGGLAGLALEVVDGGTMEQVAVSNLTISDMQTPIFIRLGDRSRRPPPPGKPATPGILRDVRISHVVATGTNAVCSSITAAAGQMVENVALTDVTLRSPGGGTPAQAEREVPEVPAVYPEARMFGPSLPCYGLYVRHVHGLTLDHVRLERAAPERRPVIVCQDIEQARLRAMEAAAPTARAALRFDDSRDLVIEGCRLKGKADAFIGLSGRRTAGVQLIKNVYTANKAVDRAADVDPAAATERR